MRPTRPAALMSPLRSGRLLFAAGAVTWAVMLSGWLTRGLPVDPSWARPLAWACWCLFVGGFSVVAWPGDRTPSHRLAVVGLALQTLAVLGLTAVGVGYFAGVLLAVIAGQAPIVLRMPVAAGWLVIQTVTFTAVVTLHARPGDAVFSALGLGGFQLFAAGAAWLARREADARTELARVNAELRATQALLSDSTRAHERLTISRELHDAIGHHLTALTLQLEVARNTSDNREAVQRAQAIARTMLGEVRAVVGTLREDRAMNLPHALELLARGVPSPRVHLELDATLNPDPEVAHAVFRCVQEALTNAIRHARAQHLWVELRAADEHIQLRIRDDGQGAETFVPGNGLNGLRERMSAIGGTLSIDAGAGGGGVQLVASVPLNRSAP